MAYTQADLDALKEAMKTGVRSVTYPDGRMITYRSMAEMKEAYRMIADEVVARSPSVMIAKHVR
jgi:hypothetical protein